MWVKSLLLFKLVFVLSFTEATDNQDTGHIKSGIFYNGVIAKRILEHLYRTGDCGFAFASGSIYRNLRGTEIFTACIYLRRHRTPAKALESAAVDCAVVGPRNLMAVYRFLGPFIYNDIKTAYMAAANLAITGSKGDDYDYDGNENQAQYTFQCMSLMVDLMVNDAIPTLTDRRDLKNIYGSMLKNSVQAGHFELAERLLIIHKTMLTSSFLSDALILAASRGDLKICKLLRQYNANTGARQSSALIKSAYRGKDMVVRWLVEKENIPVTSRANAPIRCAVQGGQTGLVQYLFDKAKEENPNLTISSLIAQAELKRCPTHMKQYLKETLGWRPEDAPIIDYSFEVYETCVGY